MPATARSKAGKFSRDKGQRGEREIIWHLSPIVDSVYREYGIDPTLEQNRIQRNLLQADKGGVDVHGLDNLAIEVKFRETLTPDSWFEDLIQKTRDSGRMPILLYRKAYAQWKCRLLVSLPGLKGNQDLVPADISFREFLTYFEAMFIQQVEKRLGMEESE